MKRNQFIRYTVLAIVSLLATNCSDDSQTTDTKNRTEHIDKKLRKKKTSSKSKKKKSRTKATDSTTEPKDELSELSYEQKCTLLLKSAMQGDAVMLKKLIDNGAYINCKNNNLATPLHYATAHPDCLKLLLESAEINVNSQDESGLTPLNYAICQEKSNIDSIRLLLNAPGIDINQPDNRKYPPLCNAILFNKKECAELLLNAPTLTIDAADKRLSTSKIAQKGLPEIAELLKKKLVERAQDWLPKQSRHMATEALAERMGITSKDYKTCLYQAIHDNDTELLFRLIAAEADINIEENGNVSPLYKAAELGNVDCVKLLLAAPYIRTHSWSLINLAIVSNDIKQFKELCTSPQNVNQTDAYGNTPLHWAARLGKLNMLQMLLDTSDQAVNTPDTMQNTPLHLAVQEGHTECVRLLLNIPTIKVNTKTKYLDSTPLICAISEGHYDCFQLLLNSPDIDVNQVDTMGYTALHHAILEEKTEYVRLLLSTRDINTNKKSTDGFTPLSLAKKLGNKEIIILLQNAGAK